jgi:twitching motility protein PilT
VKIDPLSSDETRELCYSILRPDQIKRFEEDMELDLAYEIKDLSRFRVNVFQQRESVGMCIRAIPIHISTFEELEIPEVVRGFCDRPRGLVLVTGPTGSGKTTTLAAMINYINATRAEHIMTVEDPVEFIHQDKKALINQRELLNDTLSFANALKFVLRQDPDVILVGEMRDLETIHLAITAAETGHLVFATLHTTDAVQTVDRIIDVFPTYQQQQVRMQLSVNLIGVVSQALLKRCDRKGRIAAFEVLVAVPAVRNLVREAKTHQIGSLIQVGAKHGMQTLDQALARLVAQRAVTYEEALAKVTDLKEFNTLCGRDAQGNPLPVAR